MKLRDPGFRPGSIIRGIQLHAGWECYILKPWVPGYSAFEIAGPLFFARNTSRCRPARRPPTLRYPN